MSARDRQAPQGEARTTISTDRSFLAGLGLTGVALAIAGVSFVLLVGAVSFDVWPHASPERLGAPFELGENADADSEEASPSAPGDPSDGASLTAALLSEPVVPASSSGSPGGGKGFPGGGGGPKDPGSEHPAPLQAPPDPGPTPSNRGFGGGGDDDDDGEGDDDDDGGSLSDWSSGKDRPRGESEQRGNRGSRGRHGSRGSRGGKVKPPKAVSPPLPDHHDDDDDDDDDDD